MTEKQKDGGPAFPVHGGGDPVNDDPRNHTLGGGMSLRDWLAGQALPFLGPVVTKDGVFSSDGKPINEDSVARAAYLIADAMLKARAATGEAP